MKLEIRQKIRDRFSRFHSLRLLQQEHNEDLF